MIIDITREMNDEEYKRYQNLLDRYWTKHDYLQRHEDNYCINDKEYEKLDERIINLVTEEEEEYLAELEARTITCAKKFKYDYGWHVHDNLHDFNVLLWLEKERIINYVVIRKIINDDKFWLCLKNIDDYKLFQAKWRGLFDSSFLIKQKWFKQEMKQKEQIYWASENLGNNFLYDYKNKDGYFRNGTEAALKLMWS